MVRLPFRRISISHLLLDLLHGFSSYETVVVQPDELLLSMKVIEDLLDLSVRRALSVTLPECSRRESRVALILGKFDQLLDEFFPVRRKPDHEVRYAIPRLGPRELPLLAQLAEHSLKQSIIKIRVQPKPDFVAACG